jgi:site-specific DNA-methyltransferase (adenine-specific)
VTEIILGDCLEIMKQYPDKHFDLVVTDPPYGIGVDKTMHKQGGSKYGKAATHKRNYAATNWDSSIPSKECFDEIFRVSKNQIIFGGNYFVEYLSNSPCWLVWDKNNGDNGFADCELAWTSFKSAVRLKKYTWNGMIQQDMKNKEERYHPTQKPTALMRWCIEKYSQVGDKILDPFAGSGSTLRAAKDLHRDCVGIEINPTYVDVIKMRERQEVLL